MGTRGGCRRPGRAYLSLLCGAAPGRLFFSRDGPAGQESFSGGAGILGITVNDKRSI